MVAGKPSSGWKLRREWIRVKWGDSIVSNRGSSLMSRPAPTTSARDFPPRHPTKLPGSIWGITTFFNSAHYASKRANFRLFRESLRPQGLPLLAVELVYDDGPFDLEKSDAEILVQRRGGAVLWQKERLLNIALEHLPADCDKVVSLDADVLFLNPNWVADTAALLEQYVFVQPFSSLLRLPPRRTSLDDCGKSPPKAIPSAAYCWAHRQGGFKGAPGHCLAARRSVLDENGLYDRLIVGGADRAIISAAMGLDPSDISCLNAFSAQLLDDVREWAGRLSRDCRGSLFYTEGQLLHLWHGTIANRGYGKRVGLLDAFNVHEDIRIDDQGTWSWSSDKPALHEAIRHYFLARQEDTLPPSPWHRRWIRSLKKCLSWLRPASVGPASHGDAASAGDVSS